ncbi:MAG: DMT family transporter [Anaerolineae bacterium]|jgi:drug/metabolite transporter (DMT)-like permease
MSGILMGLLCAASWAIGSVMMRDLSRKLDPFTLNAPRTTVGGLAMLAITLLSGRSAGYGAVTLPELGFMLGSMLVGGGIGDTLYVISLKRIGVSRAFPISSVYPAITVLLGVAFLSESLSLRLVAGMVLVVVGVVLISYQPRHQTLPEDGATGGVVAALGAAVMWAVAAILVAPGIAGHDTVMVASIRVTALAIALWLVVALRKTGGLLKQLDWREWVIVAVGGFIGWGLGSMLFVETIAALGPAKAAIITSSSPLFALPLSLVFLKERPTWLVPVGTALAVAGLVLVS